MESDDVDGVPVGWTFSGDQIGLSCDEPNSGDRCCQISNEPPERFSFLSREIDARKYLNKRIRLRAAIRTDVSGANNQAQLMMGITRNDGQDPPASNFFYNMYDRPITESNWQNYDIVADVAGDSGIIHIGCFLNGKGTVWIDDVSLEVVDLSVALTDLQPEVNDKELLHPKPGIYHLTGARTVTFTSDSNQTATLKYPLPLAYRDQAPISYHLTSKPDGAIQSISIERDKLENYIATVTLRQVGNGAKIELAFKSTILVGPSLFAPAEGDYTIPKEWPAQARPWLKATWCVASDDPKFVEIGKSIRNETDSVPRIIELVLERRKESEKQATENASRATAVASLDKRGACTNNANLVAAMLRACDVPARVLAGFPSWSGPLETHYIVEAWMPNYGWYPIESSKDLFPWPNSGQINVSIVPIEHEAREVAKQRHSAWAGVPYLSLTEFAGWQFRTTGTIEGGRHLCPHECKFGYPVSGSAEQWKRSIPSAQQGWHRWLSEQKGVELQSIRFGKEGHITGLRQLVFDSTDE